MRMSPYKKQWLSSAKNIWITGTIPVCNLRYSSSLATLQASAGNLQRRLGGSNTCRWSRNEALFSYPSVCHSCLPSHIECSCTIACSRTAEVPHSVERPGRYPSDRGRNNADVWVGRHVPLHN